MDSYYFLSLIGLKVLFPELQGTYFLPMGRARSRVFFLLSVLVLLLFAQPQGPCNDTSPHRLAIPGLIRPAMVGTSRAGFPVTDI